MKKNLTTGFSSAAGKKQQGVVLIVWLIILLVVTLLGVSGMQSSSMQLKMAKNGSDRQTAFQSAEYTLKEAENAILLGGHSPSAFHSSTTGLDRYDEACSDGVCFFGTFDVGDQPSDCQLLPKPDLPVWADQTADWNVWSVGGRHEEIDIPGALGTPNGKYIAEFMCYVDKDDVSPCTSTNNIGCAALYRITSLATSQDETARVMLQSMIKVVYQ